jgi:hypothetical protein
MQVTHRPYWYQPMKICNCETRAVEKFAPCHTVPNEGPRSTSWRSTTSMPLITKCMSVSRLSSCMDLILRTDASAHCGWGVLRNILWTEEACYSCENVFTVHLWVGVICLLSMNMGIKSVSVSAFGLESPVKWSWDTHLLPESMTARPYRDFLETPILELLEDVPLTMRRELWLQYNGAQAHFG